MKTQTLQQELEAAKKVADREQKKVKELEDKIAKAEEAMEPKNAWETIKTLLAVYKHLKCNPKKDVIKIDKFTKEEHEVLIGIVERMRVCKVYNDGKLPAKNERWYPWSARKTAGAGLVFSHSYYNGGLALLNSPSRLSFVNSEASDAYAENFMKTEEKIIQL